MTYGGSNMFVIHIWKWLILFGLAIAFTGLIFMIEGYTFKQDNKKWYNMHKETRPCLNKIGWVLTISGFILQAIGVIIS